MLFAHEGLDSSSGTTLPWPQRSFSGSHGSWTERPKACAVQQR